MSPPPHPDPARQLAERASAVAAARAAIREARAAQASPAPATDNREEPPAMTVDHIELTQAYEATPAALADVAAEAIRALNHATFPGQARLVFPSEVYSVIGSLQALVGMLPQALVQLATWLEDEHTAERVVANYGPFDGRTVEAVGAAGTELAMAIAYLTNVHAALGRAHTATAGLSAVEDAEVTP